MRLALNPRARRLIRSVPRTTVYTAMELILLSLLAIQGARLVWTLVTPVDPVGEWRSGAFRPAPVSTALLGSFDPFFRLNGAAPTVVTSLNLTLFGVSENRATGRGSAIIATPDGLQRSFAVGDQIMPGVTLAAVSFDSVTIDSSGSREQLFLDQSTPAAAVAPGTTPAPPPATPVPPPPIVTTTAVPPPPPPSPADVISSMVQYQPRMAAGRVNGIVVNPQGDGEAFRNSGLQPGDVITAVNGRPVNSAEQAQAVAGSEASVTVERAGRPVTLRVRLPR